jgi:CysZ protein
MKFIRNLSLGFKSYQSAVSFIVTNGFAKYLIIPLAIFGLIFYFGHQFGTLSDVAQTSIEAKEYSWGFIGRIWLLIKVQFYALLKFLFIDATKYLVIMFLSPLLAILSEKTEEVLTGNKYQFNLKQLLKDVKRGIGIAAIMLIVEFGIVFLVWTPICWILEINDYIYEAVAVLIGFYFYGFAYIDYINERLRLTVKESWKFMRKHDGLAFAIGGVYSLFYKIPSLINTDNNWVNIFLDNFGVLFAPVLAIVAATIAMHNLVDLNNSKFAEKSTLDVTQLTK